MFSKMFGSARGEGSSVNSSPQQHWNISAKISFDLHKPADFESTSPIHQKLDQFDSFLNSQLGGQRLNTISQFIFLPGDQNYKVHKETLFTLLILHFNNRVCN